ncbi:MAG: hypothetical protein FD165_478 [Gammaproteobacteria bacterium]|nr:MAG: hypothetical protein FD165_478 [Gammaproteobacteria bacterium]TND02260.1 MAG: hypothetical protein FD120_2424 [Gammaproteobacteria bacterium]
MQVQGTGDCGNVQPSKKKAVARHALSIIVLAGALCGGAPVPAVFAGPGDLDPTFGVGGKVVSDFSAAGADIDSANGVAIQTDGKILVVGYTYDSGTIPTQHFMVARYNTEGGLDAGFGVGGLVQSDPGFPGVFYDVAVQGDGKIVAAGTIQTTPLTTGARIIVARYHSNGTQDLSFGSGGFVVTSAGSSGTGGSAIAIQPDSKIVVAGNTGLALNGLNFALARYNTDGSLDTLFDGDGIVTTDIGGSGDVALDLALQADGKIVAVGRSYDLAHFPNAILAVVRYNSDGSLDTTFDGDGKVTTTIGSSIDTANAVAIQGDGRIVAAGSRINAGNGAPDMVVLRYLTTGGLDTSFGGTGIVITPFPTFQSATNDVVIQSSGKIVVGGFATGEPGPASGNDFALARYNSDGTLDATFGTAGLVTTPFGAPALGRDDFGNALVMQADGKLVLVGDSKTFSGDTDVALARYSGETVVTNQPPVANAGPDQVVMCSSSAGAAVMLNGAGSSDPDGDALSYAWTGPFAEGGGAVAGAGPIVTLALGASTVSLVVNDGQVDSAADDVLITVGVAVSGLKPPLDMLVPAGGIVTFPDKAFRQGRTLPLKLELSCGGMPLVDVVNKPRIVRLERMGSPLDIDTLDLDAGAANDSGLVFRLSDSQWVYNLSSRDLLTGTYVVIIRLPDGTDHQAGFVLK